jgi:hypothetical protein
LLGRLTIYGLDQPLSPTWRAFLARVASLGERDQAPPVLTLGAGAIEVSDDAALLSVEEWHTQRAGASFRVFAAEPALVVSGGPGERHARVRPRPWDGRGLWLCDGPCGEGVRRVPVPVFTEWVGPDSLLLSASLRVRDTRAAPYGEDGVLFIEATLAGAVKDAWVAATEMDTNQNMLFARDQYRLAPGLTVSFYALEIDPTNRHWALGDELPLTKAPGWTRDRLDRAAGNLDRRIGAYDLAQHLGVSPPLPRR